MAIQRYSALPTLAGGIPAAPTPAPYFAPSPDLGRIQFLTQQAGAPGVRKLRMGLLRALQEGRRAENPNVQAMLAREAIAGYGEGLESVMGGARREGMGLYAPEFAAMGEEGRMNWLAQKEKEYADYLATLAQYKEEKRISDIEAAEKKERKRLASGVWTAADTRSSPSGFGTAGFSTAPSSWTPSPTLYGAGSEEKYREYMRAPLLQAEPIPYHSNLSPSYQGLYSTQPYTFTENGVMQEGTRITRLEEGDESGFNSVLFNISSY